FLSHPGNTRFEHLRTLSNLGFNRLSIGVQDFSPKIMAAINRRQCPKDIARVVVQARQLGYKSINFDLIYGLPFQKARDIKRNISMVRGLKPDRIAFYGYAHVPWKTANQRGFSEADLAKGEEKRAMYEMGKAAFEKMGYVSVGMDHFALPTDDLAIAQQEGRLHRNFMGYTAQDSSLLIGLGASAISESKRMFIQNERKVEAYQETVNRGEMAICRGHELNEEDLLLREQIKRVLCTHQTTWGPAEQSLEAWDQVVNRLAKLQKDGLVKIGRNQIQVEPRGEAYIRNIAQCFDERYWRKRPEQKLFSQSI
ncbi:MAG: radical SAM protein, partial [Bacteroidota bacterium]